jgi:hypothetical protein
MARIIVISDTPRRPSIDAPVLMDESVTPEHLADAHASHQIIERMAWAVRDEQKLRARNGAASNGKAGAHNGNVGASNGKARWAA